MHVILALGDNMRPLRETVVVRAKNAGDQPWRQCVCEHKKSQVAWRAVVVVVCFLLTFSRLCAPMTAANPTYGQINKGVKI